MFGIDRAFRFVMRLKELNGESYTMYRNFWQLLLLTCDLWPMFTVLYLPFRVTSLTINHRLTYLFCHFVITTLWLRLKFRVTTLTINSHQGREEEKRLSFLYKRKAVTKPENLSPDENCAPVKSKLKHPPGHLTSFPARGGGNLVNLVFPGSRHLITTHRGWGIWSLLDFMLRPW